MAGGCGLDEGWLELWVTPEGQLLVRGVLLETSEI